MERMGDGFLENGYAVTKVEDLDALAEISRHVGQITSEFLGTSRVMDPQELFNGISSFLEPSQLNDLRLEIINKLLVSRRFHENYYACARSAVHQLVGNDLAMQKNMGLNIQLPGDRSSLLAPHSDIWGSECSPFELVVWLPLVDCYRTKSVFILPPARDRYWRERLGEFKSMDQCFDLIKDDVVWADVRYGEVLLFTPTVLHGNRVNEESESRWSFNIRFKGLFTPYAGKGLGDYFQPLSIRPVTRIGMQFKFPQAGHDDRK